MTRWMDEWMTRQMDELKLHVTMPFTICNEHTWPPKTQSFSLYRTFSSSRPPFTSHKSGQTLETLKVNGLRALDINKEERLTDFDLGSTSSLKQQMTPSFLHGLGATTLQEGSVVIAW